MVERIFKAQFLARKSYLGKRIEARKLCAADRQMDEQAEVQAYRGTLGGYNSSTIHSSQLNRTIVSQTTYSN